MSALADKLEAKLGEFVPESFFERGAFLKPDEWREILHALRAQSPYVPESQLREAARIAIAKYKLHAGEFSEEAIIADAVSAARTISRSQE